MTTARVANEYVEVVVASHVQARVANEYVEVVVATAPSGGWAVGTVRMNEGAP